MRKKIAVLLLCFTMVVPAFAWRRHDNTANDLKQFDNRTPEQKAWSDKFARGEMWVIGITLILGQILELFEAPRVHRVVM
ncbi:MAG: hypothetical protein LBM02_05115 [Lachnospiraceae bacterium]|jgi:hypothetical protein|nr:hypothetical protein [Lachnospiraceae bacterium]